MSSDLIGETVQVCEAKNDRIKCMTGRIENKTEEKIEVEKVKPVSANLTQVITTQTSGEIFDEKLVLLNEDEV